MLFRSATLDLLIDREIIVELSISNFSNFYTKDITGLSDAERAQFEVTGVARTQLIKELRAKTGQEGLFYQALSKNEQGEAIKSVVDAMDANLKTLVDKVREERKQADKITEGVVNDGEAATHDIFTPYERQIIRETNNTVFKVDLSAYEVQKDYSDDMREWVENGNEWMPKVRNDEDKREKLIADEGLARLVRNLKNAEKGLKFSKNENKDIIQREVDRYIDSYAKNILIRRFRECFMQGIDKPIDRTDDAFKLLVEQFGSEDLAYREAVSRKSEDQASRVDILEKQAVAYYQDQVRAQVDRYKKGLSTNESLGGQVIESLEDVYWLPESIIDDYFTVSHILISYSDAQNAEITQMKEDIRVEAKTVEDYAKLLERLESEVSGVMRNEKGEEVGSAKSASVILDELNDALEGLSQENAQKRIETFREFIYKYNTDPGMVNPEFEYVMGINNSKMVEPFTDAARELYGYEKKQVFESGQPVLSDGKPTYEWKERSDFTPIKSSVSGLVMTDYGAHIIMYTRPLKDFINTSMEGTVNNYQKFLFAQQTSYGDYYLGDYVPSETYFDCIVEKLNKPAYENHEKSLLITYKQRKDADEKLVNPIKKYKGNYKDLF